ncbi:hypothetical protein ACLB1E_22745 [Escherichia coli]
MPVIYTPTVGAACERFSRDPPLFTWRVYLLPEPPQYGRDSRKRRTHNIKVIVVTDGERILGLVTRASAGWAFRFGQTVALHPPAGGISPAYTLPVVLDVGTNNQQLLNDPLYMGWRNPRITDDEYYEFVDDLIQAVKQRLPDVLLQFEDFAQKNAMPLLNRYRNESVPLTMTFRAPRR